MVDDIAPLSFVERIARLEERMGNLVALLDEIRADQKQLAEVIARASGGLRVLLLLGSVASLVAALRTLSSWAAGVVGHGPPGLP